MSGEEYLREQVGELKKRVREAEEEKRVAEEENKQMRRGRGGVRGREDLIRGPGAGGLLIAGRAICSAMHVGLQGQERMYVEMQGQQGKENDDRRFYFSSRHLNTRPPNFRRIPLRYQHGGIG